MDSPNEVPPTWVSEEVGTPAEFTPVLNQFMDEVIDSFVTWDLLLVFSGHPEVVGSAATFAALLGRSQEDVAGALDHLSQKGLLRLYRSTENEKLFELDPDSDLAGPLGEFADFNDHQENRLKILSRLLHRGVSR
jgi:hypothetical protein